MRQQNSSQDFEQLCLLGEVGYALDQIERRLRTDVKIAKAGSVFEGLVSGACFANFGHDVVRIN